VPRRVGETNRFSSLVLQTVRVVKEQGMESLSGGCDRLAGSHAADRSDALSASQDRSRGENET